MAFIYKITNNVNGKVYIGKTVNSIEHRWKQHIYDSCKGDYFNRPLYKAFHKYGIENFTIEAIEECQAEEASLYEQYWIKKYNSYIGFNNSNGYNVTLGGDGKLLCNYEEIYQYWLEGLTLVQIREITHYDMDSIHNALFDRGVTSIQIKQRADGVNSHKVAQIDKNTNEIIAVYDSQQKAAIALGKSQSCGANIGRVCNGQRKTAYGYKWKLI